MKAPKEKLPRILTEQELSQFRTAISDERDLLAVELALEAALRESEVLHLEKDNVLWSEGLIQPFGKGGTHREVPMTDRLREVFHRAMRARPAEAGHDRVLWNKRNPAKELRARRSLWKIVKKYARRAGIAHRVTFHDLRHTCLTRFYRATGDLKRTQLLARHTRMETTANIYVHLASNDLREDMAKLDTRPKWVKWWNTLKPNLGVPEFFKPKSTPLVFGETIGREKELAHLRNCLRQRSHCVLSGGRGSGRRHLLAQVAGERIYRLERLTPLRETLVELCEILKQDGHLSEMPKGRSTTPFLRAVVLVGKTADFTLVIDSIDGLTKQEARALEQIAKTWVIFGAIEPSDKSAMQQVFFGRASFVEVNNLTKTETFELARKAIVKTGLALADETAYLNHLWAANGGNPGAILNSVETSQKTGNLKPETASGLKVLPAVHLLTAIWTLVVLSRYPASALSEPEWKVWATIIIVGLLPFILLDRLLKMRRKKN